jgi:hypothetical protein
MAWFGKKDTSKKSPSKTAASAQVSKTGERTGGGSTEGTHHHQRPGAASGKSAEIRAQALANARKAREAIGDEALQKIAAALKKKQESELEKAKAKIAETDATRVAEEILAMLETRH